MEKYQLYIDGKFQDASSKKTFESLNPATEEPWALVAEAETEEGIRKYKTHLVETELPGASRRHAGINQCHDDQNERGGICFM